MVDEKIEELNNEDDQGVTSLTCNPMMIQYYIGTYTIEIMSKSEIHLYTLIISEGKLHKELRLQNMYKKKDLPIKLKHIGFRGDITFSIQNFPSYQKKRRL